MTTEREHAHAHSAAHRAAAHDDLAPGRASRSAQLDAPSQPIISALIQRKARDDNGVAAGADTAIAHASGSSGAALPEAVMRKFEASLGTDLSSVRVHTGAASEAAAHSVGAKAYTMGQDIHFGAGHYDPTGAGQHLLAHEVAHTVQQRGGSPTRQNKLEVSSPGDAFEHEADRAADAMVSGAPVQVSAASGLSRHVVARGIATAYSKDKDLKQLPPPPAFGAADGSFAAMATAVQASVKGDAAANVPAPSSGLAGSTKNLILCRDHAESSQVYYSTNVPSKYNPFGAGNFNAQYAASAKADATWAIGMLANVSVAGAATESWVSLVNASNKSWADLVKQADSMSIEVNHKTEKDMFGGTKEGEQQINKGEVGSAGMGLAVEAKKMGIKAPDTGAYKKAMQDYGAARNALVPTQQRIIMTVIPTNLAAIKAKVQDATDEKEKWETVASATSTFETGLTIAFGAGKFVEGGVGEIHTTDEGVQVPKFDAEGASKQATGVLAKGINIRIEAIQKQIDSYNSNLGNYATVEEANKLKADVGAYKNDLVKLKTQADNVDAEQVKLDTAFKEFGKAVDEAMIKKGGAAKGSDNNAQAAALFTAIRTASTNTKGAIDGLSSGGAGDLPGLYGVLAKQATDRQASETGGDGRRDGRSAVFGIEAGRWSAANRAVAGIGGALGSRAAQIQGLEQEFLSEFARSSGGTDSIK